MRLIKVSFNDIIILSFELGVGAIQESPLLQA